MSERPPFDKFAPLSKPVPSFGDMIREEGSCGMPVPAGAPAMPDFHRELGEPSARWAYRADAIEGWPDTAALRNAAAGLSEPYEPRTPKVGPQWHKPQPLPDGLLPVAAFDPAFLPEAIAPWVMDISDRMQCPPDFVAIPAIVALGSVIGRKVALRPQRKTDWYVVPNLWGCIVGRPGAMKSPAMNEALKPLQRLEDEARKRNESAAKEHALGMEAFKFRKEEAQKQVRAAMKTKNDKPDVARLLDIDKPEEPKTRRYIVNDATYEALGAILADNPNGTLAFRDELVSLLKTLDREEYVAARGFFSDSMEWNRQLHL